jgi:hypothetical protein
MDLFSSRAVAVTVTVTVTVTGELDRLASEISGRLRQVLAPARIGQDPARQVRHREREEQAVKIRLNRARQRPGDGRGLDEDRQACLQPFCSMAERCITWPSMACSAGARRLLAGETRQGCFSAGR